MLDPPSSQANARQRQGAQANSVSSSKPIPDGGSTSMAASSAERQHRRHRSASGRRCRLPMASRRQDPPPPPSAPAASGCPPSYPITTSRRKPIFIHRTIRHDPTSTVRLADPHRPQNRHLPNQPK
ncbi:hypothetical protein ACLOJK_036890 [Asimina triloba]